ncbi:4-hydroxy-tetrahydrodipicolinate synthase 1 [Acrocarpospora pleiomorpha]|uniref:4-hydroxy-tetrahydrodipicolinate synthase n=1 Tax=Acrocarpospora pleiomorpha TaxID=90975 RepID=A0A5M3XHB9_9ACTN|nr:4-hydroxy-tetrahydrodipicolinate synthase [Acrocarpospora pleiomorpha]GES20624.1 4-hydroxy-tetrahydrodipicolinate synthase 1 [Acrocarpospora pleiomorpha]
MTMLVAMVTPFRNDGSLDAEGAQTLAAYLVENQACDGLVLNGTTGEAPTTTDEEKETLIRAVAEAVGDRATIIAGAGSFDTRHAVELARTAEKAGAEGLLVVTPYYSRPTQEGIRHHITTIADATALPVTLYDIPARTGTALTTDTLLRLAEHPRVTGVKDAAYDLLKSAEVLAATGLRYYSGADELNLPLYAIGATGVISTIGHVAGTTIKAMLHAYDQGDTRTATVLHHHLTPIVSAIMTKAPGTVTVKALLNDRSLPAGPVRLPLVPADTDLLSHLRQACE